MVPERSPHDILKKIPAPGLTSERVREQECAPQIPVFLRRFTGKEVAGLHQISTKGKP